jgi:UPF0716 family protein affecting phage T7 exclusion
VFGGLLMIAPGLVIGLVGLSLMLIATVHSTWIKVEATPQVSRPSTQ